MPSEHTTEDQGPAWARPNPLLCRGCDWPWWTADNGTRYAFSTYGQRVAIDPGRRVVVAFNNAWPTTYAAEAVATRAALILAIRKAIDSETQGK